MALQKDNIVDWTDIEQIYTNLNTARTKFSFSTVPIPNEEGNKPIPSHITSLKDLVQNMTTNSWLSSVAQTNSVSTPTTGDLLQPTSATQLSSIIDNINNTCIHFGGNYGYNSTYFSGNYGWDGFSPNGVCVGTYYGWNSGFFGWDSGFYSWNSGFYSFS